MTTMMIQPDRREASAARKVGCCANNKKVVGSHPTYLMTLPSDVNDSKWMFNVGFHIVQAGAKLFDLAFRSLKCQALEEQSWKLYSIAQYLMGWWQNGGQVRNCQSVTRTIGNVITLRYYINAHLWLDYFTLLYIWIECPLSQLGGVLFLTVPIQSHIEVAPEDVASKQMAAIAFVYFKWLPLCFPNTMGTSVGSQIERAELHVVWELNSQSPCVAAFHSPPSRYSWPQTLIMVTLLCFRDVSIFRWMAR